MKALVIADRAPHINIAEVVARESAELIITLGDLTREDILGLEGIRHLPKIGVYGNHDSSNYMEELGIMNMHLKTWDFNGLRFGGFQGCVRYKENPDAVMYTQQEAVSMMEGFPYVDIFLSHCPPYGINDEPQEIAHQGFKALREYIDEKKPKVWLHGHTYPDENLLVRQHGATRVEYVYRYRLVEL